MSVKTPLFVRCGCGAELRTEVYPTSVAAEVAARWMQEHVHVEPPKPERVVVRVPRGAPRLRATRALRTNQSDAA